jgi:hypothetical protein
MMTFDKFGRHLVKNPQLVLTKFSDKEILSSSYMFYNVILKFEANAIVDNISCVPQKTHSQQAMTKVKYVLVPDVK